MKLLLISGVYHQKLNRLIPNKQTKIGVITVLHMDLFLGLIMNDKSLV